MIEENYNKKENIVIIISVIIICLFAALCQRYDNSINKEISKSNNVHNEIYWKDYYPKHINDDNDIFFPIK